MPYKTPTKTLINKIETLSTKLDADQLTAFLDILDQMALMVEEAHRLPAKPLITSNKNEQHTLTKLH